MRRPESLADVRGDASVFPAEILDDCESALMLFCAGFYGRNDAIWLAEAGLQDVVAIDNDRAKLNVMGELYPASWQFICADAFSCTHVFGPGSYDVVVLDAFGGEHADQALELLEDWCRISRRFVVLTAIGEAAHETPDGWTSRFVHRSDHLGGCYWLVLERS